MGPSSARMAQTGGQKSQAGAAGTMPGQFAKSEMSETSSSMEEGDISGAGMAADEASGPTGRPQDAEIQ